MSTNQQIALPSEQTGDKPTVGNMIQQLRPELARALPKGMDADRIARLALTVLRTSEMEARKRGNANASLANCSPESFAGALLTAASLGLEPGVNGECYLVPYRRECTLIIGYQGYAKLFWQHPLAQHLDAQAVHEADDFDYAYGTAPFLRHKPARGERGEVIYYYAAATLSTGGSSFVVLTPDEVKTLRGGKVGTSGDIADPMKWMERKTAFRQLIKTLPRSTQLNTALVVDEQTGSELRAMHQPAAAPVPAGVDTATGEIAGPTPPVDEADPWATGERQ
jgi:recombination protein RecT